jgi:hypothetical protein
MKDKERKNLHEETTKVISKRKRIRNKKNETDIVVRQLV